MHEPPEVSTTFADITNPVGEVGHEISAFKHHHHHHHHHHHSSFDLPQLAVLTFVKNLCSKKRLDEFR